MHDSSTGGVKKTLKKIWRRFYWAICKQDVKDWCRTYKICVSRKGLSRKGKPSLQIYNVGVSFERVQINVLGPFLKTSSGNRYLLVVVDCFTTWVEAFPMKNVGAKTVAEVFLEQVIARHGVSLEIHIDQERSFE